MLKAIRLLPRKNCARFYSQNVKLRQIQEASKTVDPFSKIKINCSASATVRPVDLFECPNSDKLRVFAYSTTGKSSSEIDIKGDEKNVEVSARDKLGAKEDTKFVFEVPVKCNLEITAGKDVSIAEMYSDYIDVKSQKNIFTKNLRGTSIELLSQEGDITCDGLTLAQEIKIQTNHRGNIHLDKIQGDAMTCASSKGTISTNACYAGVSKFTTQTGTLNLKNVHKQATVYVLEEGDINMTGIHGNLLIKANGGNLNLQFSEVMDDTIIMSNDSKHVSINISDLVEENCFIELNSDEIILDKSASHLKDRLQGNKFRLGNGENKNKLLVSVTGKLALGKLSWADSLKSSLGFREM